MEQESEEAAERLALANLGALKDQLLQTFRAWAKRNGWDASDYKAADGPNVNLLTPLGEQCSFYEAARSLERIASMRAVDPAALAEQFAYRPPNEGTAELPAQLNKRGQPSLVIFAIWDGAALQGFAGDNPSPPKKPAVLVALEGESVESAEWKDPVKMYALMEYGFTLGPHGTEPETEDEDIPF